MDLHHLLLAGLPAHSGLPRDADTAAARRLCSKGPEPELGAGPPVPCLDLNPALPLLGFRAQSWNCFHMTIHSWRLMVLPSTVKVQSPLWWIVPRSKLSPRWASRGARSSPKRKV